VVLNAAGRSAQPILDAAPAITYRIFLPMASRSSQCEPGPEEAAIAARMAQHPDQHRAQLVCNPILSRVAEERALDLGVRNYFSHTNPDGHGANYLVQQAGYILPSWYNQAPDGNNIESLAAGYNTEAQAWDGWMGSTGHRTHLLGLTDFWAAQIDYGVGHAYVPGSQYGHYWVVLTARRGP
jgi:uncharacterized protein YkwD